MDVATTVTQVMQYDVLAARRTVIPGVVFHAEDCVSRQISSFFWLQFISSSPATINFKLVLIMLPRNKHVDQERKSYRLL